MMYRACYVSPPLPLFPPDEKLFFLPDHLSVPPFL
jgi:hypothetical protein